MAVDTGNGATITLGTTGAIGNVRRIVPPKESLGSLDASHLGTTGFKEYIPDDLSDTAEAEFEIEFSTTIANPGLGTVETITITWPLQAGQSVAAKIAGTAFISGWDYPELANGQIQYHMVKVRFDGYTGPAFTAAS